MNEQEYNCPICTRPTPRHCQERHHLIPKCKKGKETIILCRSCGDMLHKLFSVKDLKKKYNTLESILKDERVQKWIEWVKKKPNDFNICMATKKGRR